MNVKRTMNASGSRKRPKLADPDPESYRKADNAERDLHKYFIWRGMSLNIPIRSVNHHFDNDLVTTNYFNPSDWLKLLVKDYPCLVAGGSSSLEDQLTAFWQLYECYHPTHAVFEQHRR